MPPFPANLVPPQGLRPIRPIRPMKPFAIMCLLTGVVILGLGAWLTALIFFSLAAAAGFQAAIANRNS